MTGDPFDHYLEPDDDDRFDLYKDDGWSNRDLLMRRHVVDGRYAGPKGEQEPT